MPWPSSGRKNIGILIGSWHTRKRCSQSGTPRKKHCWTTSKIPDPAHATLSKQLEARPTRPPAAVPKSTCRPCAPRSNQLLTETTLWECGRGSKLPPVPRTSKQPRSNQTLARPLLIRASSCNDGSSIISSFTRHRTLSRTLPPAPCLPARQPWRSLTRHPAHAGGD